MPFQARFLFKSISTYTTSKLRVWVRWRRRRLDWTVSDENNNSGVFVRFFNPDDNPSIAVREGYEVQIDDKADNSIHQTGAVYDFLAPSKVASKPAANGIQWKYKYSINRILLS